MRKLICEICGSEELVKDHGVFICQACGCSYSVEEVRKLVMEEQPEKQTPVQTGNDQGKYGESGQPQSQGKFGEKQEQIQSNNWVCPECETINDGDVCALCGYSNNASEDNKTVLAVEVTNPEPDYPQRVRNKKIPKKLFAAIIAVVVIVTGLMLMPDGWRKIDGKYYYYNHGIKTTGKAEIDGYQYFFDENGAMKTGWVWLSGNRYYYDTDGRMVTGVCEINSEMCTFDNQGNLMSKVRFLRESEIPSSKTSSDDTYYKRNDGKKGKGKYQILSEPIEDCTQLNIKVCISNLKAGTVDKWGFYIRNLNGEWSRAGDIDIINNVSGSANIYFNSPVTFDAYVCFCESLGSYWNFSFTQTLSNIEVIEFY